MISYFKKAFANLLIVTTFFFVSTESFANSMEIAVTVDGLPAHGDLPPGMTRMDVANLMIRAFQKHHIIPVYGFVVGNLVNNENDYAVLQRWQKVGNKLGNHSFSHWDLSEVTAPNYIEDIKKTDLILKKIVKDNSYKYFRYPYLSEGETYEKRDAVLNYLKSQNYQIAPITIDFSDYIFNEMYIRCIRSTDKNSIELLKQAYIKQALDALTIVHLQSEQLFHHDIKHILLLHIGVFEALMMDDLLTAYEQHGVKFISLQQALTDPIYQIKTNIVRKDGFSQLGKLRLAKGLKNPEEVKEIIKNSPLKKLNNICSSPTSSS